jgi:hypothetical protein
MSLDPDQQILEELLQWARGHSGRWRVPDRRGVQLRTLLARATETFSAATHLTGEGYGRQAIMLARPLFEDLVLAAWTKWVADPDWIVSRLNEQSRYTALLWNELIDKYPSLGARVSQAEISSAERDRYKVLFGAYGELSWWAVREIEEVPGKGRYRARGKHRNLKTLVEDLASRAMPESSRLVVISSSSGPPQGLINRLWYLYDVVNRVNNEVLHYTSRAYITAFDHTNKVWREGPSEDMLVIARRTLLMTYDKLFFIMFQHGNTALETDFTNSVGRRISAVVSEGS